MSSIENKNNNNNNNTNTNVHYPSPPSPLDDPSCANILDCPSLRWGFIGCGRVTFDFMQSLEHISTATIVAVSTRNSLDRATEFANKFICNKNPNIIPYGSYDDMINDDKNNPMDIIYVGNIHVYRRIIGEKCLLANKNVLLEKPFACTLEDAEYLINLAKERNLFIMEGMWTRFFPAVEHARRITTTSNNNNRNSSTEEEDGVVSSTSIGDVVSVHSDFNFNANDNEIYPTSFFYNQKLGGGATYLVGPYPVAACTLFYNHNNNEASGGCGYGCGEPDNIHVVGRVDEQTGVDIQAAVIMSFSPKTITNEAEAETEDSIATSTTLPRKPGYGLACLSYGLLCESDETTTVMGTKGKIIIHSPGHCPTKLTVSIKGVGRGTKAKEITYEYKLPADTPEIIKRGGFNYPNSAGFCYEAAAVARCIAAGKKEAIQYTHRETLTNMKILEEIHNQLGVDAPPTPNNNT